MIIVINIKYKYIIIYSRVETKKRSSENAIILVVNYLIHSAGRIHTYDSCMVCVFIYNWPLIIHY